MWCLCNDYFTNFDEFFYGFCAFQNYFLKIEFRKTWNLW